MGARNCADFVPKSSLADQGQELAAQGFGVLTGAAFEPGAVLVGDECGQRFPVVVRRNRRETAAADCRDARTLRLDTPPRLGVIGRADEMLLACAHLQRDRPLRGLRQEHVRIEPPADLAREPEPVETARGEDDRVQATLVIPQGWSEGLTNGKPIPLELYLDASDTNVAPELYGRVQESLGDFQLAERQEMIDALPEDVFTMAEKIPIEVRHQFVSAMEQWSIEKHNLYNPKERFIDYVIPGVIGLILQLITVTLMASTIARERESGTLYQLMVTALRRREIVIGKVIPYLAISILLILMIVALAGWHFGVEFHQPGVLAVICWLATTAARGGAKRRISA